jgi:site-specific recombinase XerD
LSVSFGFCVKRNLTCRQKLVYRAIAIERKTEQRLLNGRALGIGEVQALFHVCAQDKSVKGSRDAALIAVLYSTGLRRSEVVAVDLIDWEEQDNCLIVRSGKGDKDRTNYLDNGATAALLDWLICGGTNQERCFILHAGVVKLRHEG